MPRKKPQASYRHNVDIDEASQVAAFMLGKQPGDEFDNEVDDLLQEEFGCDLYQFKDMLGRLLPMVGTFRSALTGTHYRAFGIIEKNGDTLALAKMPIDAKNQKNYK